MLDLSLDHLGLITRPDDEARERLGEIEDGLSRIVDAIGIGETVRITARQGGY